jgi:hypothetical protein
MISFEEIVNAVLTRNDWTIQAADKCAEFLHHMGPGLADSAVHLQHCDLAHCLKL